MKKFNFIFFVLCGFFLASTYADSVVVPPDRFMYQATTEVLAELKDLTPSQTQQVNYLIDRKIIPHVDIEYMTKWVAGRKAWTKASAVEKKEFSEVFTKLMIQTYASTLFMIQDKTISYSRPPKTDYMTAKTVPISSEIIQSNKDPIHIIYQLRLVGKEWKIFDLLIEGVSLLKGLQGQYEEVIAQKGLKGGIDAMRARLTEKSS